jgi:hypothetical protein
MQLCYNNTIVGYPERVKIFALLRRNYYWPKDYSDVRKYVKFCQIYRRVKGVTSAKVEKFLPLLGKFCGREAAKPA